LAWCQGRFL